MTQPLLRRPATRSKAPGVLRLREMTGICDLCNRPRGIGNHNVCSRQRQEKYRHLWEAP